MEDKNLKSTTDRRNFLGTIAASAAALGIATIGSPLQACSRNCISTWKCR